MPRTQFTLDVAGTLEFYPPEGRPDSSATLNIYTGGDSLLTGTFPATVALDSVSTTINASASKGATAVSLASGTGVVVGRRYIIKTAKGQRVEVVARGIDGTTLSLDQRLSVAVESGDAFDGHRLAYSLSAAQNGELRRRLRAVWSYDVDGEAQDWQTYYSVVREPFRIPLSESDIETRSHNFGEYTDRFASWRRLIPGAHDEIAEMLIVEQHDPDLIRDRDGLKTAIIYCLLSLFFESIPGEFVRADRMMTRCEKAVSRVIKGKTWYDEDHDQVVDGEPQTVTLADGSQVVVMSSDGDDGDLREIGGRDELGLQASYMRVG
jgi:hypothetical protein